MKRIANGIVAGLGLLAAKVPALVRDLLGLAGAALVAYGVWLIAPPYGFIAAGALLMLGAILSALAPANPR